VNAGRRATAFILALVAVTGTATAAHLANDTEGHTSVEQTLVPIGDPEAGYTNLKLGPGEPYVVRDGVREKNPDIPTAQDGRDRRRVSLAYVSQMTDFQLADEESPARVEFADPGPASAWRPQEGFTPFQIDATVRQINRFARASPVPQGDGTRNAMDFALLTGDQADNQHLNETVWVRDLLEGNGPMTFNSGTTDPAAYANSATLSPACAAYVLQEGGAAAAAAEAGRYTGVQDYDDYPVGGPPLPLYYDPDDPRGQWSSWPEYDGLMDRAQQVPVEPAGLDVPFYITNGNHDVLVQGNEDANVAFEDIATGCFKALGTTNEVTKPGPPDGPDPNYLLSPADVGMLVAPDPDRRIVDKPEIKQIYGATNEGPGDDNHGFAHVDPEENVESGGSASYYAWDPEQTPGMRFISIDTNSEGGQTAEGVAPGSSNGNLDDPQFQWLKRELRGAQERDQLVVLFGHHPVRSMNTQVRDEQALPCTTNDEHGHDQNPGCDRDARPSDDDPDTPGVGCIHNGTDAQNLTCGGPGNHESFVELIDQFPNVIAYVPGHTHEHRLTPFVRGDGTTWWEINTSAVIDPPNQSRLIEVMDNRDGTLSIFNTVVDHAGPATAQEGCPDPAPDCAADFDARQLASIGRTFAYNDPDNDGSGTGQVIERNAELLLEDPRAARAGGGGRPGGSERCASRTALRSVGLRPRGRRVRISLRRTRPEPIQVDVFKTSLGRRVVRERLVARFDGRTGPFTWNGRANRPGRRVTDGFYFVRWRSSRTDVRRMVLRRSGGRWSRRPAFSLRSCGLLGAFKLRRPVFGGRGNRSLAVAFRLARAADVRVELLRGNRVVKRLRSTRRSAGTTHRLRFGAPRRRGDYRVRLTVVRGGTRVVRALVSRRL
jgi:hypothetical protein